MHPQHTLSGRLTGLLPLVGLLACRPAAPGAIPAPAATAGPSALPAVGPQARPLTLWTVSALEAAEAEAPSLRRSLAAAALDLDAGAAGLEVVTKPAYGEAGIVAFLRSSAEVAPERLPDACVLPLESLAQLQTLGLLQPLRDEVLAARAAAAFPFATRLAGPAVAPWGLPVAVDVLHAIARDAPVPERWGDSGAEPLVLPLGGGAWAPELAPLLGIYAAQGGDLASLGSGTADPAAAATDAFRALAEGLSGGRLLLPADGRTPRAAWSRFVAGEAPAAVVSSGTVIAHQTAFPGMRWGPLPGPRGSAPAIAWGWALALTTPDPQRQARVLELLRRVTAAENAADVLSAGLLPPQREAWADRVAAGLAPAPDAAYLAFVEEQLQGANALEGLDRWGPAWASAGQALAAGAGAQAATAALGQEAAP